MRKLKMLIAALAISGMALLPLANSARAQVVIYNHGHPVRVAHAAKKEWSKVKSGARTGYHKAANATTREWSKAKSGARTGYRKAANATTKEWSKVKSGVRYNTYKLSHGGHTSIAEQRQDARREVLYRARLRREQYRARLQRQR